MKPNLRPNKTKFAKKNQTTVLKPNHARLVNDISAVLLIACSLVIGISLATYSPLDSCWSKTSEAAIVRNELGVIGAYFSDLLYYLFGVSAWLLPTGMFYLAAFKLIRRKIEPGNFYSVSRVVAYVFLLLTASGFEYLLLFSEPNYLPDGFGGALGAFFDGQLHDLIGEGMMSIVLLVIMIATFSFIFKIKWIYIAEKIGTIIEESYLWLSSQLGRRDEFELTDTDVSNLVKSELSQPELAPQGGNSRYKFTVERQLETDEKLLPDALEEFKIHLEEERVYAEELVEDAPIIMPDFSAINQVDKEERVDDEILAIQEESNAPLNRLIDFSEFESINDSDFNNLDLAITNDLSQFDAEVTADAESISDKLLHSIDLSNVFGSLATHTESNVDLPNSNYQTVLANELRDGFILPSTNLLSMPTKSGSFMTVEQQSEVSEIIATTYSDFGIAIEVCNIESGPVITRYELVPPRGVKGEKIVGYAKEVARELTMPSIRIVENIVGKNTMGIEVPNVDRQTIFLREIFDSEQFRNNESKLTLALGKDISGKVIVTDLAKMPHLLVAGTTGSGKSVSVNAMILSILYKATPEEVKFIMIDPKMVELSFYQDIPHLLAPVVIDMSQAANALKWTVAEMERRYKIMAKVGTKKISDYNNKIDQARKKGQPLFNPYTLDNPEELEKWPFIVVVIDELADLMMTEGKKIEQYIARIAQKARAVGIHLIIATQRPSADVITGLIKTNIPARIAFRIPTAIDSRIILGQSGAETLLGQGDMLFAASGGGIRRIHGAFVDDDELHEIVEFLKAQRAPEYDDEILTGDIDIVIPGVENDSGNDGVESDPVFDQAVKYILDTKRCSISALQTQFGIGYNKGARIMSHLEKIGMVKRTERGTFELLRHTID